MIATKMLTEQTAAAGPKSTGGGHTLAEYFYIATLVQPQWPSESDSKVSIFFQINPYNPD